MSTPDINVLGLTERLKDIKKILKTEFDPVTREHLWKECNRISLQLAPPDPNLSQKKTQANLQNPYCI